MKRVNQEFISKHQHYEVEVSNLIDGCFEGVEGYDVMVKIEMRQEILSVPFMIDWLVGQNKWKDFFEYLTIGREGLRSVPWRVAKTFCNSLLNLTIELYGEEKEAEQAEEC